MTTEHANKANSENRLLSQGTAGRVYGEFRLYKNRGAHSERRKVVDATDIVKPLPELCQSNRDAINEVAVSSSLHETNNTLPGTNDLYDVEIASFIDCFPCGLTFEDMGGLKKHLASFHKKTTRRFDLPICEETPPHTLEKHAVMDHDQPQIDEARSQPNGEASSSSQKIAKAQEPVPVFNGNGTDRFKTKCTWCDKEFLCEPVDAETMADATGFMCPKCKEKLCGVLERSLSRSNQQ
ncbi:hypothetical protein L1987_78151 [Smallanthus sonchifolius]|uniref:Uncharacterized protein n=1 Tax=Smallanthus sonchifolius TaxID=185202 RepID=A0ACB8ZBL8_9ASTR|nr:hypothetical protein L1987_78151 [Smallanthus sonchifolius]